MRLTVEGNRLACSAPKGVLDEELKLQLREWKGELIELLSHAEHANHDALSKTPPVRKIGISLLSYGQQRLWYLDQFDPGSPAYNITAALQLEGHLDRAALETALGEIVRRHLVLRTAIVSVDGSPKFR